MANKKNILQTSTCESNMGKLMELIEISAKVQGQLFNCLKVSDGVDVYYFVICLQYKQKTTYKYIRLVACVNIIKTLPRKYRPLQAIQNKNNKV